jgi:hypothetical protein
MLPIITKVPGYSRANVQMPDVNATAKTVSGQALSWLQTRGCEDAVNNVTALKR